MIRSATGAPPSRGSAHPSRGPKDIQIEQQTRASGGDAPLAGKLRRALVVLARLAAVALGLCTAAAFAGRQFFLFDWISHFRPQYAILGALTIGILLLDRPRARSWRYGALAALATVINGALVLSCFWGAAPAAPYPPKMQTLTLLSANVLSQNRDHGRLIALVRREQPQVLALQEVTARWARALRALHGAYPHRLVKARPDNFGIALLSRLPLRHPRVIDLGGSGLPSIEAIIELPEGQRVTLLLTHPMPPVGSEGFRLRDAQLAAASARLRLLPGPRILAGDLNATVLSPSYRWALGRSGLSDARRGRGLLTTWPADAGLLGALFAVPIDHLWHSDELTVLRFAVGPAVGSDHLPLRATLGITRR